MINAVLFNPYSVSTQLKTTQPPRSNSWHWCLVCSIGIFFLFTQSVVAQDNLQAWIRTFNGSGGGNDDARKVATDNSGNIYVGGTVYNTISGNTTNDFIVIKYNSGGTKQWEKIYNTGIGFNDQLKDMVVDGSGNVYVTGSVNKVNVNSSFLTIKYNSAGTQQWVKTYNASDEYSTPNAVFTDGLGNVYVTGVLNQNYHTIKYNSAGTQQWLATYNNGANSYDFATAIWVDGSGNVYVTGGSAGSAGSYTGTTSPGTITATNSTGKLTFQFYRSSLSGAPG
jgi:hypothetical protein